MPLSLRLQPADLDAIHYKENSKSQYSQANNILKGIPIEETSSILDVGCGHGKIIAELSRLAPKGQSIGIDPSENMIQLASSSFPESLYSNLEFYQMKAEDMDFYNESFDIIVCTNTFMWIRDPNKALNHMERFLKHGGHLVIFTYDKETPYVKLFESVLYESFPQFAETSAVNTMLSIDEHKDILERNRMKIEQFEVQDIVFSYKDKDAFRNYILGWLSCYIFMPKELHDPFIEKVIEKSSEFCLKSESNEITIPHRTISIRAYKE